MKKLMPYGLILAAAIAIGLWAAPASAQCQGGMMGMCSDTTCHDPGETCSPENCPSGMMGNCMNDSTCMGGMMGGCHEGGGGGSCNMPDCPMTEMCNMMGMNCGGMMGSCADSMGCHSSQPTPRDHAHTRAQLDGSPNPFNPTTTLSFSLPEAVAVDLRLFDTNSRLIEVLAAGQFQAGNHAVVFNGAHLPAGIYMARLQAGGEVSTLKLVLVK